MATKYLQGVLSISFGSVLGTGGPATTFVQIGNTVQDTAVMKQANDAVTSFYIEESASPAFQARKSGDITFNWSCYDIQVSNLMTFFGGSKTGTAPAEIWAAPNVIVPQNLTLQVISLTGQVITVNNCLVAPQVNFDLGKTKAGRIDFQGTVLQPTLAGVPRFTIGTDE